MLPDSLFSGTAIPALEQVVGFSQARHNVLAGNIANMDTPGYRALDLSPEKFQAKLKSAIEDRRQSAGVSGADAGTMFGEDAIASVADNLQSILHHDDSNVGLEQQVTEMAKNQMQHNLALAIMSSQFRLLQSAISERA
jgi:flagellar basal-body rod protein FlgB